MMAASIDAFGLDQPTPRYMRLPLLIREAAEGSLPRGLFPAVLVTGTISVAFVSALQLWVNWRLAGASADFSDMLFGELIEWGSWAAAVPLIVMLDRRTASTPLGRRLALHLALGVGVFALQNGVMTWLGQALETGPVPPFWQAYALRALLKIPTAALVYALILASILFVRLLLDHHRAETGRMSLEAELAQARLTNLKMRLQPHFLFNALHLMGSLAREGRIDDTVEVVTELGELLRRSLRDVEQQEVQLQEELDFLDSYLNIQQIRFGDRLQFHYAIAEDARSAVVPSLLLQPLVENAIRHGLDAGHRAGRIEVDIACHAGVLHIAVRDNGVGCTPDAEEGIGLATTRSRLRHLYGSGYGLILRRLPEGGSEVRVELPFRSSAPQPRRELVNA